MSKHSADLSQISAIIKSQSTEKDKVAGKIDQFDNFFASEGEQKDGNMAARKGQYATMVNSFYDLVTDFYEYGWGQSFHFAPRHKFETFEQSLSRHELYLAYQLRLKEGDKVLDVGCGVGGPAREIALFSKAHITGLNNNAYQITRATDLATQANLYPEFINFQKGDFLKMPFEDNSFDGIYSIEATCHSPELVRVYREIFRVLKPGQLYGNYEWCMTDKWDPSNEAHNVIKHEIEHGNSLPNLVTTADAIAAMKEAGFEIVMTKDFALDSDIPWYEPFAAVNLSMRGIAASKFGRFLTNNILYVLETARIAPAGTCNVQKMLCLGADALEAGGKTGIFTPLFFMLARKPLDK